jgi:CrcB protein
MSWSHLFGLAVAGGLGTLARAGVTELALRWCDRDFPWGTFAVNVFGGFVFGLITAIGRGRFTLPAGLETVLLVGFLGGFTTYSSFAFQSVELLEQGRLLAATANLIGTTIAALLAVVAGLQLGRLAG